MKEARHWAAEACRDLDRDDLVDTAELGTSELVTNAILHGAPPIAVRMRGTRRFPRIEVLDGSRNPPTANESMSGDDLFSTFGRGLGMVATCSHAWGADLLEDGKVVWFEPAAEPVDAPDLTGQIFSPPDPVRLVSPRFLDRGPAVQFIGFPLRVFLDWRQHFRELRRELRLLALAHEGDYPVAHTLTELFEQFDEQMREARGTETIEHWAATGAESADIDLVFGDGAPEVLGKLLDVLELADAFCRDERLLSLAATDQQRDFQAWFSGEVIRQAGGAGPLPWLGRHTVDQPHSR